MTQKLETQIPELNQARLLKIFQMIGHARFVELVKICLNLLKTKADERIRTHEHVALIFKISFVFFKSFKIRGACPPIYV
jgi:hypothetical protein